jgi:hypothetical protein
MSLVGKKFCQVDAISEMGDNMKINIFEEATKKQQKFYYFGIQKILLSYALLNCTLFKLLYQNLINEILL